MTDTMQLRIGDDGWAVMPEYGILRTLYVSVGGDDTTNVGTYASPYRTITHTLAQSKWPDGCAILLRRGDTFDERAPIKQGGALDRPFVLGAYGDVSAPRPVLRRVSVQAPYVVVADLDITPAVVGQDSGLGVAPALLVGLPVSTTEPDSERAPSIEKGNRKGRSMAAVGYRGRR